jgi:hypothetical protein
VGARVSSNPTIQNNPECFDAPGVNIYLNAHPRAAEKWRLDCFAPDKTSTLLFWLRVRSTFIDSSTVVFCKRWLGKDAQVLLT